LGTNPNPAASAPQKYGDRDPDACDVCSAVLLMDEWYWRNSKTLLIVQDIPPVNGLSREPQQRAFYRVLIKKSVIGWVKQTFTEYPGASHEGQHYGYGVVISRLKFVSLSDHPKPATDYHLKTGQRE